MVKTQKFGRGLFNTRDCKFNIYFLIKTYISTNSYLHIHFNVLMLKKLLKLRNCATSLKIFGLWQFHDSLEILELQQSAMPPETRLRFLQYSRRYRIHNTWYRVIGYRIHDTEHKIWDSDYRKQNTEHRIQDTGYRI